ncbi:cathelicidin-related peptide Oh-Cath-like [Thamnophis elegans]|uniref:cathelicidin-related peptide Oh-Cath-like n=1 Tax=Thamnophis elegans TaxID=35005 RepID=UPI001378328A|nr:cathelicidin-related peptide Oh-Cath-like [Thamnophis elegans]
MEGFFWKTLLLVGALSASGDSAPSQSPLSFEAAVEQGVVIYNSKAEGDTLYRLLEAAPQPDWDPNSDGTQELKFTIKETVCRPEGEVSLDKCDFKEDGVVRECTGEFFLGEKPPVAVVTCEAVEEIEEEEEEEKAEEGEEKEEEKNQEEEEEEDEPERLKKLRKKIKKGFGKIRKGFGKIKKDFGRIRKGSRRIRKLGEKIGKLYGILQLSNKVPSGKTAR